MEKNTFHYLTVKGYSMNIKKLNEELSKYVINESKKIDALDKPAKSNNFDKYDEDQLSDGFTTDISFEDGIYTISDDLFAVEDKDLLKALNKAIRQHRDFEYISEDLEWDDFDDVIWEYTPADDEHPHGQLYFVYVQE